LDSERFGRLLARLGLAAAQSLLEFRVVSETYALEFIATGLTHRESA
jgi:hypothetical protein